MNNAESKLGRSPVEAPPNVISVDFKKETSPGIDELIRQLNEKISTWEAQIKKRDELQEAIKMIEKDLISVMQGIASQPRMDEFKENLQLGDESVSGEYNLQTDRLRQMVEGVEHFTLLLGDYQNRRDALRTQLEDIEGNLRTTDAVIDELLKQIGINREKYDGEVVPINGGVDVSSAA